MTVAMDFASSFPPWRSRSRLGVAAAVSLLTAVAALLFACETSLSSPSSPFAGRPIKVHGLELPARVHGSSIQLATPAGFQSRFWPGVNLGSTVPGRQPGEVAARAGDYDRWFTEMGQLGVRVIRVYTLLDPSFYTELAAYNKAHPSAPLYVIHGIWIPEQRLAHTHNLWDPKLLREQRRLIDEVHAAVSGHLHVAPRAGQAYGTWTTNINRWVIGWSFGIEMDPHLLHKSQKLNPPRPYRGTYIRTTGRSTSTEAWLAKQLNHLAGLDAKAGWSRPATFTNWLTLDPLHHRYEPLASEDLVSVDAMHLRATGRWPAGFFASYHAYPYYPDFMRLTPAYANAPDPYAAYLKALRRHHQGQAVMVTEFGVPSSLGAAHRGPLGRDQGDHSEAQAMSMDAGMLHDIKNLGFAGGVVFEWTDEWFKLTWNTLDLERPGNRRQLWRNPLTNEEHFGVVSTDAGLEAQVSIDGDGSDWSSANSQVQWESPSGLRELRMAHDEAYLYLTAYLDDAQAALAGGVTFGLDVRPGENAGLPGVAGSPMPGADTAVHLTSDSIQVQRAAWTDETAAQYGIAYHYLHGIQPSDLLQGSGVWRPPIMLLSAPRKIPATGERRPTETLNLGNLPLASQADDSRTLADAGAHTVEIRIPWAFLGFGDPSSHTLTLPRTDGRIATEKIPQSNRIAVQAYADDGSLLATAAPGYGWSNWNGVSYSERRKQGWDVLAQAFAQTGG